MSEQELIRQGWTKRTTYDEPRLSEMAELYRELGFEVRLEPVEPESMPDCSECVKLDPAGFRTLYTRPVGGG